MNQQQKSEMKFQIDKKKVFFSIILFISGNLIAFAEEKNIIPSDGFSTESLLRGVLGIAFLIFISFLISN